MEDRVPGVSSASVPQAKPTIKHNEGRGAWVLTAYGISGLAMFGMIAYFFSDFISR